MATVRTKAFYISRNTIT